MTSGGIRTSVKAYINVQRVAALAADHENNEAINTHLAEIAEASMAAASTRLCDGNMPCLPILSSANKSCEANQLPLGSDPISVNGEPLSPEEVVKLQTCPNPPKKLKPGRCYWYDNVSGLWGKEGQKPSEVISPHLHVGGGMKENASNGSTKVSINGRKITKVELRMLQLVGVNCAGNPNFWLYEDGTYQEEGMNVKGSIWSTPGTKLVHALLSLPVPFKSSTSVIPDIIEPQRDPQKILLVGCSGSGANTIFKQAKILYEAIPFSVDERESIKSTIQKNVYKYLVILLEVRGRFHDECLAKTRQPLVSAHSAKTPYAIGPKLKTFADWLVKTSASGYLEAIFPAATREFSAFVEELWNERAIQATYKRSCEKKMLPSVASYFIKRAVHILKVNYEPTDQDILYAEGDTSSNGLACVELSFPQSECQYDYFYTTDQHESFLRYKLIRAHAGLGESSEWLENYEYVEMVILCVSLSDYDQFSAEGTNKMLKGKAVFESIVTHPSFEEMNFLLLLNDFDFFAKKIDQVPLAQCDWFDDFKPAISSDLGQRAYEYIAVKFKRLYTSLTGKKLYVSLVEEFESDSVVAALKYSTGILKWDKYYTDSDSDSDSFYSDSELD